MESLADEAKRIIKARKSLSISRIPEKARDAFIKLANDEFCGDYGMTIKWLMDVATIWMPKIEELERRITLLEHQRSTKMIKTISGKILSGGETK